ncbi:MAG: ATP-binding cassette domain-containing protein [Acidobacteriota bacterium]
MIRCSLSCRRGAFALDLSLEMPPGVTALVGPSGSGKSTILHLLLGIERLHSGEIWWKDHLIERAPGGPRVPPEKRRFGAVFQEGLLFPHLNVEKNIYFGFRRGSVAHGTRMQEWMKLLGLNALRERRPATLSGGEVRRVAMARALATAPRALMLDEPLSGLDPALKRETLLALRRLRRQLEFPVLYVTHQPAEVLAIADRVVRLQGGRVLWEGRPSRILQDAVGLGTDEPNNFLDVRVVGRQTDGQMQLQWGEYRLQAVLNGVTPGDATTLLVRPSEVLLAVGGPGQISARNQLRMRVRSILPLGDRSWVELGGPDPFFALITREAEKELSLAAGVEVTAMFKALAVERANAGADGPST